MFNINKKGMAKKSIRILAQFGVASNSWLRRVCKLFAMMLKPVYGTLANDPK